MRHHISTLIDLLPPAWVLACLAAVPAIFCLISALAANVTRAAG